MKQFFHIIILFLSAVLVGCVLLLGMSRIFFRPAEKIDEGVEGKYFSVLGDSLTAYEGYTIAGLSAYYNPENVSLDSMWWSVAARETGMIPCVINGGGGTGVTELLADAGVPTAGNSERCEYLYTEEQMPDVIFVLLGGNDVIQEVSEDIIENAYEEMLERIKQTYPEAEVYACTYYRLPGDLREPMIRLNDVIRDAANNTGVDCIDIEDCAISSGNPQEYFMDYDAETGLGVHVNQEGQEIMGEAIASSFLEIRNSR